LSTWSVPSRCQKLCTGMFILIKGLIFHYLYFTAVIQVTT
jgi:hypothetical protein